MLHFTHYTMASETSEKQAPARDEQGRLLPGNTANPGGRPKGTFSLSTMLRDALQDIYVDPKTKKKTPYAVLLIQRMLDKAIADGNEKMIREIWDRIEGKSVQPINLGGQAGNPLQFMEVDPETQAKIVAMQARWFTEEKKPRTKVATVPQPVGNQVTTKVKVKVKAKVKKKK